MEQSLPQRYLAEPIHISAGEHARWTTVFEPRVLKRRAKLITEAVERLAFQGESIEGPRCERRRLRIIKRHLTGYRPLYAAWLRVLDNNHALRRWFDRPVA